MILITENTQCKKHQMLNKIKALSHVAQNQREGKLKAKTMETRLGMRFGIRMSMWHGSEGRPDIVTSQYRGKRF